MSQPVDKLKLIGLAHLKLGKKPKEVAELCEVNYAKALRWAKELLAAEKRNAVLDLFQMDELVLNSLLEMVQTDVSNAVELLGEDSTIVGEVVKDIAKGAVGLQILETEFQDTAKTLNQQIKTLALIANEADTIVMLADALAKLQNSFFAKGTNVNIANFSDGGFEKFLGD